MHLLAMHRAGKARASRPRLATRPPCGARRTCPRAATPTARAGSMRRRPRRRPRAARPSRWSWARPTQARGGAWGARSRCRHARALRPAGFPLGTVGEKGVRAEPVNAWRWPAWGLLQSLSLGPTLAVGAASGLQRARAHCRAASCRASAPAAKAPTRPAPAAQAAAARRARAGQRRGGGRPRSARTWPCASWCRSRCTAPACCARSRTACCWTAPPTTRCCRRAALRGPRPVSPRRACSSPLRRSHVAPAPGRKPASCAAPRRPSPKRWAAQGA